MAVTALPFRYALAANTAGVDFATAVRNSTPTEPSGDGVFDLLSQELGVGTRDYAAPTYLQLVPFGTDADNETFGMKLYGYNPTIPADLVTDTAIYVPQLLVHLTCTLCARTFSDQAASAFFCDTIVVTKGPADNAQWLSLISPADDSVASVLVHVRGFRYIAFDFDLGTAAAANCLWRPME